MYVYIYIYIVYTYIYIYRERERDSSSASRACETVCFNVLKYAMRICDALCLSSKSLTLRKRLVYIGVLFALLSILNPFFAILQKIRLMPHQPIIRPIPIYIYIYIYIYTYIHINTHTHTHTHIHLYIYIYTYCKVDPPAKTNNAIRPISLLTLWISEGSTRAQS